MTVMRCDLCIETCFHIHIIVHESSFEAFEGSWLVISKAWALQNWARYITWQCNTISKVQTFTGGHVGLVAVVLVQLGEASDCQ